jgi:hypothetical protein
MGGVGIRMGGGGRPVWGNGIVGWKGIGTHWDGKAITNGCNSDAVPHAVLKRAGTILDHCVSLFFPVSVDCHYGIVSYGEVLLFSAKKREEVLNPRFWKRLRCIFIFIRFRFIRFIFIRFCGQHPGQWYVAILDSAMQPVLHGYVNILCTGLVCPQAPATPGLCASQVPPRLPSPD